MGKKITHLLFANFFNNKEKAVTFLMPQTFLNCLASKTIP
ncbi:hypothetical protein RV17_GL001245 [Enterococcus thailandicus]|nr:hypothetical protein RV17_GL001245 [Enterococcus thailandicus]